MRADWIRLMIAATCANSLPRPPQHQGLKLLAVEFDFRAVPSTCPVKLALIQPSRRKPDTHAVKHQNFQSLTHQTEAKRPEPC